MKKIQYIPERLYTKECPLNNKAGSELCMKCVYHAAHTKATLKKRGKLCNKYFLYCVADEKLPKSTD